MRTFRFKPELRLSFLPMYNLWCNLGKSVWSWTCDIVRLVFDWIAHLERYILLKTPLESDQWFQSYEQLKDSQNNRKKTNETNFFFWLYLAIYAPDFWVWLIPLDCNTFMLSLCVVILLDFTYFYSFSILFYK